MRQLGRGDVCHPRRVWSPDISPKSKWYQQYANLWGCYTNLCQWVGHYGDDDVALSNFNNNVAALAL